MTRSPLASLILFLLFIFFLFKGPGHTWLEGGQNHCGIPFWGVFGEFTTHVRTYFSGWIESDVHGDGILDFDPWPNGWVLLEGPSGFLGLVQRESERQPTIFVGSPRIVTGRFEYIFPPVDSGALVSIRRLLRCGAGACQNRPSVDLLEALG